MRNERRAYGVTDDAGRTQRVGATWIRNAPRTPDPVNPTQPRVHKGVSTGGQLRASEFDEPAPLDLLAMCSGDGDAADLLTVAAGVADNPDRARRLMNALTACRTQAGRDLMVACRREGVVGDGLRPSEYDGLAEAGFDAELLGQVRMSNLTWRDILDSPVDPEHVRVIVASPLLCHLLDLGSPWVQDGLRTAPADTLRYAGRDEMDPDAAWSAIAGTTPERRERILAAFDAGVTEPALIERTDHSVEVLAGIRGAWSTPRQHASPEIVLAAADLGHDGESASHWGQLLATSYSRGRLEDTGMKPQAIRDLSGVGGLAEVVVWYEAGFRTATEIGRWATAVSPSVLSPKELGRYRRTGADPDQVSAYRDALAMRGRAISVGEVHRIDRLARRHPHPLSLGGRVAVINAMPQRYDEWRADRLGCLESLVALDPDQARRLLPTGLPLNRLAQYAGHPDPWAAGEPYRQAYENRTGTPWPYTRPAE